ncbi:MAG: hypothetical protein ACREBR_03155, partial [bacterium]
MSIEDDGTGEYQGLRINNTYLINTVAGSKIDMNAERVAKLKAYLAGNILLPRSGRMTKYKTALFMNVVKSFQLVIIVETENRDEVNPFLKTIQLNNSCPVKLLHVQSLSTTFYHYGNVDSEILAVVHFAGFLDLNKLGSTLVARKLPERPRRDRGWADELDKIPSREDKVATVISTLKTTPIYYFGHSVLRMWDGEELHLGVIRHCRMDRGQKKGVLVGSWNIHYPFYDGNSLGDEETLSVDEVAEGIVLAR